MHIGITFLCTRIVRAKSRKNFKHLNLRWSNRPPVSSAEQQKLLRELFPAISKKDLLLIFFFSILHPFNIWCETTFGTIQGWSPRKEPTFNDSIFTQPARNVGPTSGQQQYDVATSYRCRHDVGPLFRASWVFFLNILQVIHMRWSLFYLFPNVVHFWIKIVTRITYLCNIILAYVI